MTLTQFEADAHSPTDQRIGVIDTDVHQQLFALDAVIKRLPARWQEYLALIGLRTPTGESGNPGTRVWTHRLDAVTPSGGEPGSDPEFAREQLLDVYGMSGAILNNIGPLVLRGTGQLPFELQDAMVRALNDWTLEEWFPSDPRWYAAINVTAERPDAAVREIERCRALSDRFVQVILERRADYPHGNPRYWPIYEACEHFGIPVGFHTAAASRVTASGNVSYYVERHVDFALSNFNSLASFVFEGAFDRFPGLQLVYVEQSWSWTVPFSWRLDAAWRKLRAEVPHLQRAPSEYVRDHVWLTTQPMEEPENLAEYEDLYRLLDESGSGDKLMFSSDYPHWDFDAPADSVPAWLPLEIRRKILGENASRLYGIPLTGDGIPASSRAEAAR
jgi:predicted TIM-barrel fold metal-dependent hydrolase